MTHYYEGNEAFIETLRRWGVTLFAGVNGGGLIHVAKYFEPFTDLSQARDGRSRMFTLGEYVAGFVPLGYYYASGRIAGGIATTGAATKLLGSGITDAKLHNIPAVYIVALNSTLSIGKAPLQDVSEHGMSIVPQLKAEFGEGAFVIDDIDRLEAQLRRAQEILQQSKPVVFAFHPDMLSKEAVVDVPPRPPAKKTDLAGLSRFLSEFPAMSHKHRVILYVGEEAARCPGIHDRITRFSELLAAPTVWSINGANAVSRSNRFGYGYISFGGNDRAMELWRSLGPDDVLITLGFCPGEYSLNLAKLPAGFTWNFTNVPEPYGHLDGHFRHRVQGGYAEVRGPIDATLDEVTRYLTDIQLDHRPRANTFGSLNDREIEPAREGYVDLIPFYQQLDRMWRPRSIGFDDVCMAYKDRQYVSQRPHPNIPFYTLHHGSAMGGAFGLGIGAKLADPERHTFVFAGDGCWRLFAGCLAEAAPLGMTLFIINNGTYGIVDKGLEVIIPDVEKPRYHARLQPIDFAAAARAYGWEGHVLRGDLANLEEIIEASYRPGRRSILVDVPVDPDQVVGLNPRLLNLTTKTYL